MTHQGHAISQFPAARKWVGVFALLAFFLQSLVVQTHIHQPPPAGTAQAAHQHLPAPIKAQDPIDQCRLCQELVQAGHFVAPSALVAIAGPSFIAALFMAAPARHDQPVTAFAWQSRAPPGR